MVRINGLLIILDSSRSVVFHALAVFPETRKSFLMVSLGDAVTQAPGHPLLAFVV